MSTPNRTSTTVASPNNDNINNNNNENTGNNNNVVDTTAEDNQSRSQYGSRSADVGATAAAENNPITNTNHNNTVRTTSEWMRRKTMSRIQNEIKKDTARRQSLEAAYNVWSECSSHIILQQQSQTRQYTTTKKRRHPSKTRNALSHRIDDGRSMSLLLSTKALGFPIIPTTTTNSNVSNHPSVTFDYYSDSGDDDDDDSNKVGTSTQQQQSPSSFVVENAAQRGWDRGSREMNEQQQPPMETTTVSLPPTTAPTNNNEHPIDDYSNDNIIYEDYNNYIDENYDHNHPIDDVGDDVNDDNHIDNDHHPAQLENDEFDDVDVTQQQYNTTSASNMNLDTAKSNPNNNGTLFSNVWKFNLRLRKKKKNVRHTIQQQQVSPTWSGNDYNRRTYYNNTNNLSALHNNIITKSSTLSTSSSCEAWMCGVCGIAFASKYSAEQHEQYHLEQIIYDLGYNDNLNYDQDLLLFPHIQQQIQMQHHSLLRRVDHDVVPGGTNPNLPKSRLKDSDKTPIRSGNTQRQSYSPQHLEDDDPINETTMLSQQQPPPPESRRREDDLTNYNVRKEQKNVVFGERDNGVDETTADHDVYDVSNRPQTGHSYDDGDIIKKSSFRGGGTKYVGTTTTTGTKKLSPVIDEFPGLDADIPDLPSDALVPRRPRGRTHSEVHFDETNLNEIHYINNDYAEDDAWGEKALFGDDDLVTCDYSNTMEKLHQRNNMNVYNNKDVMLLSTEMRNHVIRADEALVNVVLRAESLILTYTECQAEHELALLAFDKMHYDEIAYRATARQKNPSNRYRTDNENVLGKIQNKLLDAYQLIKENEGYKKGFHDHYDRKNRRGGEGDEDIAIVHTKTTLYVNVMVKNSVEVVKYELQRLAKQRWENQNQQQYNNDESGGAATTASKFERVRGIAQMNIVKLAGIALASDFTPRRIAVQLSNDLYRLLTPRLKRRGVTIETEIEYRVGPYFVLATNIKTIDWKRLIRATYKDVALRKARWKREEGDNQETENKAMRQFIISSVTDEIFFYVEEKGMEMEIKICRADIQAAFMLSALREIRADGKELKKKQQETELQEKGQILGPYLGPAVKDDKLPAVKPPNFEIPANLEFVGLELDLPVGFRRLRWALLSEKSQFMTELFFKIEAKYERIGLGTWDKHAEHIGEPNLPDSISPSDFIGAEKENEYLMPKSAFVSANMCYEKLFLLAYNDYCFCLKKRARNPDAPFGSSFIAWTQLLVVDTGNDSCHLTCSVEPEFPNGPPMVSRQIRSGMRAGTGELFVMLGATITKYADEYPRRSEQVLVPQLKQV